MSRLVCLDYGDKRIGVAVSDPLQMFARPLLVLANDASFFAELAKVLAEFTPQSLIVGMPYDMEGNQTPKCAVVERFAAKLRDEFGLHLEFYDEAFSSVDARQKLAEKGVSDSQVRGKLDMYAAAEILENYLDSKR